MSCVTCHVSPVMCHLSHVKSLFSYIYRRVSYQRGLPRLVYVDYRSIWHVKAVALLNICLSENLFLPGDWATAWVSLAEKELFCWWGWDTWGVTLSTSTGWLSESPVSSTGDSTAESSSLPDCSDWDCKEWSLPTSRHGIWHILYTDRSFWQRLTFKKKLLYISFCS